MEGPHFLNSLPQRKEEEEEEEEGIGHKVRQVLDRVIKDTLAARRWKYDYTEAGHTLKNSSVEPELIIPYLISVCLARSSADSIGDCMRSTVKKAARLAVYEEMMIRVKNHQTLPTILPDMDLSVFHQNNTTYQIDWLVYLFKIILTQQSKITISCMQQ